MNTCVADELFGGQCKNIAKPEYGDKYCDNHKNLWYKYVEEENMKDFKQLKYDFLTKTPKIMEENDFSKPHLPFNYDPDSFNHRPDSFSDHYDNSKFSNAYYDPEISRNFKHFEFTE